MGDKVLIIYAPLADFATCPWGVLEVIDGKVTLNETKARNRARAMLNAGANMFRTLRRGIWGVKVGYDWQDEGYWPLFEAYLKVLHEPGDGIGRGAEVWVDIFDGCSENWMYANYPKARRLLRKIFEKLGDLSWVKFGIGNEMNQQESIPFVKNVVIPEFKTAGRVPFALGAVYSRDDDILEAQKQAIEAGWDEITMTHTYRPVHGVKDNKSVNLLDTVCYWANNPLLCTIWSVDGVWDGDSPCDFDGPHRRPSPVQVRSFVSYVFDLAKSFKLPNGQIKFGFEYLPKAQNKNACSAKGIKAISGEYYRKWGKYPRNYGKYKPQT